jgi:hypothetical protein
MAVCLLLLHMLVGTALLGAVTHQALAIARRPDRGKTSFLSRYRSVSRPSFTNAVIVMYVLQIVLGSVIYPIYRLDVRIPLEDMQLGWAVGLFEMKEHFGGIGLASLPLYSYVWRPGGGATDRLGQRAMTWVIAAIVWFDFIVGHVINNIRGFGF